MKTLGDRKMPKMSLVSELLDDWPFKSVICLSVVSVTESDAHNINW